MFAAAAAVPEEEEGSCSAAGFGLGGGFGFVFSAAIAAQLREGGAGMPLAVRAEGGHLVGRRDLRRSPALTSPHTQTVLGSLAFLLSAVRCATTHASK